MKLPLLTLALMLGTASLVHAEQDKTLLFEDSFERKDPAPDKEAVGNGWSTNSASRAKGHKQAFLENGALRLTTHPEADHAVVAFHDAGFQNGIIELKFKLGEADNLGVEFVDRELKDVHAGHLCLTRLTLKNLAMVDQKTGGMRNDIRERTQKGDKSPELAALLKSKTKPFPLKLTADAWHTLKVTLKGDAMQAAVDGADLGEFKSEGFAHPVKRTLVLNAGKSAWVDDIKLWKLP